MNLVPLACVELTLSLCDADPCAIPLESLFDIAGQCEVDLTQLDERHGKAARDVWAATRALWNRAANGEAPDGGWARTARVVHHNRQDTGRAKIDLVDELDALDELGDAAGVVRALLGTEVDVNTIEALGAPYQVNLHTTDEGVTEMTLTFVRPTRWPVALGPGCTTAEISRTLRVLTRHAPWRDRALRRLVEVEVTVEELWSVPDRLLGESAG